MKKINFKKSEISIQNIGKQRFWFGIISGFIAAFTISLIFNRTRELIRLLTSLSQELLIFERKELMFFNSFFASLATVLGLSITIWVWMASSVNKKKKHKLYKQQIKTNTQLFFWLILFLTAQLGSLFLYFSVTEVNSFNLPLNLYKDYKLIFILTPIVIFSHAWFSVRLIYKTLNWILISFCVSLLTTFALYKTTKVDQNILNEIYYQRYKTEYDYIELEKFNSEKKYSFTYNNATIKVLKQWNTDSSIKQIIKVKEAFSKDKKVSIDSIILQKIIIHNFKKSHWYIYYDESHALNNWQYALPKDILKQIGYFNSNSSETKELFQILKEQILFVNKSKIILNYDDSYKKIDNQSKPEVSIKLIEQLSEVIDSIKSIKQYSELNKTLPKIKTDLNKIYH